MRGERRRASLLVFAPVTNDTCPARCEKLQAACDEAVSASEKHEASLTKQVEANKALDNDLKMMCVTLCGGYRRVSDCMLRYRKHKKDMVDLEDKYKRDDYGRRYACAGPAPPAAVCVKLTAPQLRYKQTRPLRRPFARMGHLRAVCWRHCPRHGRGAKFGALFHATRTLTAARHVRSRRSTRRARLSSLASFRLPCSVAAAWTP
jgi:hypothetical protein